MDIEDKTNNKFPVRCPFERLSRSDGKLYRCNSLCGRMHPKSSGELRCRKCSLNFEFAVSEDGIVDSFVSAKPIKG